MDWHYNAEMHEWRYGEPFSRSGAGAILSRDGDAWRIAVYHRGWQVGMLPAQSKDRDAAMREAEKLVQDLG